MRFRRYCFLVGLPFFVALLLSGCRKSSYPDAANTAFAAQPDGPADTVPRQRDADDAGRFIAGLPGRDGSPFANLETSEAWKDHRRRLDDAWGKAEAQLISGLQVFQKAELNDDALRKSPVFYPFGGPDALTVTLCFPQSPEYVLVGLEPSGTLPSLSQMQKQDMPKYLAGIRATVTSELGRSFFITRQMDRQFRGQVTDGLTLPILHLLARTGHVILGFRYIRLDDQGYVIDRAPTYKAPGRIGNKGIEIEFKSESEPTTHKLYYFTVNLSDERLNEDQPFLSYLDRMKGATTLLKATSYMTHKAEFSVIRKHILESSGAVLQDDSGIPYHYFGAGGWNVQLYGDYQRPYGSFRWLEQADLRHAYEAGGAKPLSLRIGYGYAKVASNLLLARRPG